jgi:hypothetical protein
MALTPRRQELFDRSNLHRPSDDMWSRLLDRILDEQHVSDEQVAAVSMAEYFRKPDGVSMGSDTVLVAVFPDSLSFAKEKRGLRGPKAETAVRFLRETTSTIGEEREWPNGQGEFAIQARNGSQPVFRIGWDWTRAGTEPRTTGTARQERDRILSAVLGFTNR